MLILIGRDSDGAFAAFKPLDEVVELIKTDPEFTVQLVDVMDKMSFDADDISIGHWMQLRNDILADMRKRARESK